MKDAAKEERQNPVCPCGDCPLGEALSAIGGRWKIRLICTLYVEAGDFYGTGKVHRKGLGHFIADYEIQETDSVV